MKDLFGCLLPALCVLSLSAGTVSWKTGDYGPASWQPADGNLLAGATCVANQISYYYEIGRETTNDPSTLTDGVVPGEDCEYSKICGVKGGSVEWKFAMRTRLSSVRIFSRWGDNGRDGIAIEGIFVSSDGVSWTSVSGSFAYDGGTSHCRAELSADDGGFIAEDIRYLMVKFSNSQENEGGGYAEIEAVGEAIADVEYGKVAKLGDGRLLVSVAYPEPDNPLVGSQAVLMTAATVSADLADWTVTECGTVTEGAGVGVFTAEPQQGASFARLAFRRQRAAGGGYDYIGLPVFGIDGLEVIGADKPFAATDVVSDVTDTSARIGFEVLQTGGADTVDVTLHLRIEGTTDERTATVSCGSGRGSIAVTGLRPGRRYAAYAVASNGAAGDTPCQPLVFAVPATALDAEIAASNGSEPGLWQIKLTGGGQQWSADVLGTKVGIGEFDRRREIGTIMAYVKEHAVGEISGYDSRWGDNVTFLYAGYMYFTAGTYYFASAQDDYANIAIDGVQVLVQPGYTVCKATWECPTAGWRKVVLGVGNASSNAGPFSEPNPPFCWSNDGGVTWRDFIDPGDGSLLRTGYPIGEIEFESFGIAGGTMTAQVGVTRVLPDVVSVYGALGTSTKPMTGTKLADLPVGTDGYTWSDVSVAGKTYAELYSADGFGTVQYGTPVFLPSTDRVQLCERGKVDPSSGDSVVVSGYIISPGTSGKASVSIRLGGRPDLSDAVEFELEGTYGAGDTFSRVINAAEASLAAGAEGYWQLVATGADGSQDATPVEPFRLAAGAALSPLTSCRGELWTGSFNGTLNDVGAGKKAYVTLYAGSSADTLRPLETLELTGIGAFIFDHDFGYVNQTVYYKFVVSNDCSIGVWQSETAVGSLALAGSLDYYWRDDVAEGAWTDPTCWAAFNGTEAVAPERARYPDNAAAVVYFDWCTNGPVRATLPSSVEVSRLIEATSGCDVTVASDAGAVITPNYGDDGLNVQRGSSLAFEGVSFVGYTAFRGTYDGQTLRFSDGALAKFGRELWWGGADSTVIVERAATLQSNYCMQMSASDSVFVLDDGNFRQAGDRLAHFAMSDTSFGEVMILKGAQPSFLVPGIRLGVYRTDNSVNMPFEIVFSVPKSGWTNAVISCSGDSFGPLFGMAYDYVDNDRVRTGLGTVALTIDRASPRFENRFSGSSLLIDWPQGIQTDRVKSLSAHGRAAFRWAGDNGDGLPTQLWADFSSAGLSVRIR